jgi:hypothetical protein
LRALSAIALIFAGFCFCSQAFQLLRMNLDAVPYIFLITDGAVADERKICRLIQAAVTSRGGKAPRISTFGIG